MSRSLTQRPAPDTLPAARTRGPLRHRALATVAALALCLSVGACTGPSGESDLKPAPTASTSSAASSPAPSAASSNCKNPLQSYAPTALPSPNDLPSGSTMEKIKKRGRLIVGVSADTYLMGSRNPFTGNIEGFDIDMLHLISNAIFGDPNRLQFKVITSGQRIDALTKGEVDVVARALTMTCDRWDQIAFSAEYYHAGQKVLVERTSTAKSMNDLKGKRVCAPAGTTTLASLSKYDVTAVPAQTHTACLVMFQQSKVDAIAGDDTILAGFAAQDPYAKVVGSATTAEPYGIGIPKQNVDMVRFVNAVLDKAKADGSWTKSYNRWLSVLGPAPKPPASQYGRAA